MCQPITLVSEQFPAGIAVDSTTVYWTNGRAVMTCPISGCNGMPTVYASGQRYAGDITVANGSVWWADTSGPPTCLSGSVLTCPANGCGVPSVLASGLGGPRSIVTDGSSVYWVDHCSSDVSACGARGCPQTLTTAPGANRIATDGRNVYWTESGGTIMTCSVASCSPTLMASGQTSPVGIAVDAINVYWVNDSTSGTIMTMPKAGGMVTTLASGQNAPVQLAVDASGVYWTNSGDGSVMRYSFQPGATNPTTLAAAQGITADAIAVDATSVYWSRTDGYNDAGFPVGSMMRVAK
jgi:hypothetical protein